MEFEFFRNLIIFKSRLSFASDSPGNKPLKRICALSKQKSKSDEFYGWLHERMQEADLTPSEVAELTRWIMVRSCEHSESGHYDSSVSFTDVLELVSWVRVRVSTLIIKDTERSEFSNWLKERLSAHTCLTDEQLQEVLAKLSDDT